MDISALADYCIKRGAILHSHEFEDIDHGKLFVIVGEDKDDFYGFFFINSNINQFLQKRPTLYQMQIPLNQENYSDILTHNSFLDCHAITPISKAKLKKQFREGKVQYKGDLTDNDLDIVMRTVRESDLFSDYEKETYFAVIKLGIR